MTSSRRLATWLCGGVVLALTGFVGGWAEPPSEEVNRKPSSYAPVRDLEYQLNFFMDRIKKDLADEAEYGTHAQRVVKDANTIAVLALVLGKHDEESTFKRPASEIIQAATRLGDHAEKLEEAKAAYAALGEAIRASGSSEALEWKSVGNIQEIMLQVPLLNTSLRGSVLSKRFTESPEKGLALAATLAAIAHVSMFDESYCGDDADREEWIELCVLMRDASKDVHEAIRRGDQEEAKEALKPLVRTCDDCHEQFRD